ncbi:MAG: hypothetical protein IPI93_11900 [Sphingobacteriaceae bacterium]|nr:hypothetical protein [Sphingobacteriaceae bacterium]
MKHWRSIDSTMSANVAFYSTCFPNVPYSLTFQWPRTGNNFCYGAFLCQPPQCQPQNRGYLRNRLKANLQSGKTYCVKFYVSIGNPSSYGIDGFAAHFSDNSLDTITTCCVPLPYLVPQVQNPTGNIISDTLNWTLVTGTFVATGNEKFMVIGNFKTDAATTKTLILPSSLPFVAADVGIDDVSCIDINLPAFAGPDAFCIPGNSVYIGRPQDVGIDEACMWFKLPNMTNAIDTAAGIWVTPTTPTSTYIVKQDICGVIKYDTVVVYQSGVGFNDLQMYSDNINLSPNPTSDNLNISFTQGISLVSITNSLGQVIRQQDLDPKIIKSFCRHRT